MYNKANVFFKLLVRITDIFKEENWNENWNTVLKINLKTIQRQSYNLEGHYNVDL